MIRSYLRLIFFASGLLVGIQTPSFIDQYKKRVDAHFQEAKNNLAEFQKTASKFFSGNIEQLIDHYKSSKDPVFVSDAKSIQQIYDSYKLLKSEKDALNKVWYLVAIHVFTSYNTSLFNETVSNYSYIVQINLYAILWGILSGCLAAIFIEIPLLLIYQFFNRIKDKWVLLKS